MPALNALQILSSGCVARELCLRVGNDYHLTLLYLLDICFPFLFIFLCLCFLFLYISMCDWFEIILPCSLQSYKIKNK